MSYADPDLSGPGTLGEVYETPWFVRWIILLKWAWEGRGWYSAYKNYCKERQLEEKV